MGKKKKIVNERAEAGSGKKHDKHAPKSKADIATAKEKQVIETNEIETESDDE